MIFLLISHIFTINRLFNALKIVLFFSSDVVGIVGGQDGNVTLIGLKDDGTIVANYYHIHEGSITKIRVSPDQEYVATASSDSTVKIWSTADLSLEKTYIRHSDTVTSIEFVSVPIQTRSAYTNWFVVSGSMDKTLRLWDIRSMVDLSFDADDAIWSLKSFPAANQLAVGFNNGTIGIYVYFYNGFSFVKSLVGHRDVVSDLAIAGPNTLASASWDTTIILWSLTDLIAIQTLSGHSSKVDALIFFNTTYLVSTSNDNSLIVWDTTSANSIGSVTSNVDYIYGAIGAIELLDQNIMVTASNTTNMLNIWETSQNPELLYSYQIGLPATSLAIVYSKIIQSCLY